MPLSKKEKDLLLRNIWNGRIHDRNLPGNLYVDTGNELHDGWEEGFGDFDKSDAALLAIAVGLNQNVYKFSAAKTFQQVKDMSNFIVDKDGFIRPFRDFRASVEPIYSQFNEQWLRTEFDTAVGQAQSAQQWEQIQADKEILPMLRYRTAGDNKVRPLHASWEGITLPVDDPFWDSHNPPSDWNCRCDLDQLEPTKETNLTEHLEKVKKESKGEITSLANDSKLFSINPAKARLVFREKGLDQHPYFTVQRSDVAFRNRNFDLPLPNDTDPL